MFTQHHISWIALLRCLSTILISVCVFIGYLVLKDLGFNIELYIAAEICEDSIAVGSVQHDGKIRYIKDVRSITRKNVSKRIYKYTLPHMQNQIKTH